MLVQRPASITGIRIAAFALALGPGIFGSPTPEVRAQSVSADKADKIAPPVLSVIVSTTISVDAAANRRPINPMVYGTAYGTATTLGDLNLPLNRMGGNNTSRYNWLQNADNRGNDWYYQSIGDNSSVAGERGDTFIRDTRNSGVVGVEPMLTIPTVGYVAILGTNRNKLASFSIAKYGAQQGNDWQWYPDAGNGVKTDGTNVTGNNPLDANIAANQTFQLGWVQHLTSTFGLGGSGGLRYYILDNEPSIWHSTHRDVHPTGATMDEIRDKTVAYATMIKDADPGALVAGPEEWGWSGYFYSGYDQQYGSLHGWGSLPDRNLHAGKDYLPWFLDQMRRQHAATGRRLLDVFTVHYYPQDGEFWGGTDSAAQLKRNRSTRSLWDPTYTDTSWISDKVNLIPRLQGWVKTYYPGTKIGITEYNWGAEGHMNGATTQADIFGIFGREGLDMATRWTTPDPSTPTYLAMKMYRNYDGSKSTFGDTNVSCSTAAPDTVSSFAAVRSIDRALTVMVIAKASSGSNNVTVNLSNFNASSTAQVWQLKATNTDLTTAAITHLSNVSVSSNAVSLTVPAPSVTMLVIPDASVAGTNVTLPVTLEGYTGNKTTVPLSVQIRQAGTTTALQTLSANLSAGGILTFSTPLRGTFDIAVQGGTFLRKKITNVTIGTTAVNLSSITLLNGDCDGDNKVTITDSSIVKKALGSVTGGTNWDAHADLNGDGSVTTADQDLLNANYRKAGDL